MLLSSGCAYCPAVLNALTELLKNGDIGQLEAINIMQHPEIAQQYKVRSVPWVKIGEIELTGAQTKAELVSAIEQSKSDGGIVDYYEGLLNNGQLQECIEHLQKHPENLALILEMLQAPQIQISVQIGIGAIMEEFTGSDTLKKLIPELTQLTKHTLARVRNDACFYLSLSTDPKVKVTINALLNDSDKEVRETARDCLEELEDIR